MPMRRLEHLNTKENLWVFILRILAEGPVHGYTFRGEIEDRFGFRPGTMTAYKVLYSLRKGGYVRVTQEGRKKVYSITPQGKEALAKAADFYSGMADRLKF